MVLIKKGKIPEERKIQITCKNCGSILEVTKSDCKFTEYRAVAHDNLPINFVVCPICRKHIFFDFFKMESGDDQR